MYCFLNICFLSVFIKLLHSPYLHLVIWHGGHWGSCFAFTDHSLCVKEIHALHSESTGLVFYFCEEKCREVLPARVLLVFRFLPICCVDYFPENFSLSGV